MHMPISQIPVIYQDAQILLVNKPSRLLSVPGRAADNKDCLITRLQQNGYPEARIVHRLDYETSGLLLLARDADSHRELSRQFQERETDKTYQALCFGQLAGDCGSIDLPLRYDPPNKPRHIVCYQQGKSALTHFRVLERCGTFCRVQLKPVTGRSHQLRVHMLSLGHPLLGDTLYAEGEALAAADRLCLHACELAFNQPQSGERLCFSCPPPF